MSLFIFYFFLIVIVSVSAQYEVPDAKVEVYYPRGLKVSIPDSDGVKLFAFHGKVNEEFTTIHDGGFYSKDINKAVDGRWTFYDPFAKLKIGDTLYYWTYVIYSADGDSQLGYQKVDQAFVVKEYLNKTNPTATVSPPLSPSPATKKPKPPPTEGPATGDECGETITTVRGRKSCAGKLVLNEVFSSSTLKHWTPEVQFATAPDFEFVWYQNRPETFNVKDGKLHISPKLTDDLYGEGFCTKEETVDLGVNCTGIAGTTQCTQKPDAFLIIPPVSSAKISTKDKFSFKYGKIEVRAKLPRGDWIYPEIYLNSKNEDYGPAYESGQMRVAFLQGNDDSSTFLQGGCLLGSSTAARKYGMKTISKRSSWAEEFHKFSLEWTEESIVLRVDDKVYGNIYPPDGGFASEKQNLNLKGTERWKSGSKMAPFDKEVYISIGVGAGGHCFEDRQDGSKPWKNSDPKSQKVFYKKRSSYSNTWGDHSTLQVDYVKVWAI